MRNCSVQVPRRSQFSVAVGKCGRGAPTNHQVPFIPPEDWHEPSDAMGDDYHVVRQTAGAGYRHVIDAEDVRARLCELPPRMLKPLDVVQLSRMTRKKKSYPCYGMQWGSTIYLYPVEDSLVEFFARPPAPAVFNETRMYGGQWIEQGGLGWRLQWSESTIRDYYLNNVLIHELGHLLDVRNTSYQDRERFAEWFAIRFGYSPSRRRELAQRGAAKMVRRRHHAT